MDTRLEDRFEIERQIYRYAETYDSGDADGFANVFTENGLGEAVFLGQSEPFSRLQGRAQIRAFAEGGRKGVLHHTSGIVFDEIDTDSARTRAMVLVTQQVDDPVILTHGVYQDRWQKTGDGWRIAHRLYVSYGYRTSVEAEIKSSEPLRADNA